MMEHTGRRSGQARFVCLEVVERPSPERIVIVSGFGERAEWYRNLLADPRCFISMGRVRRAPARARFMTSEEASAALNRYQRAHPGAWHRLRQVIEKAVGHPVGQLPMVELLLVLTPGDPERTRKRLTDHGPRHRVTLSGKSGCWPGASHVAAALRSSSSARHQTVAAQTVVAVQLGGSARVIRTSEIAQKHITAHHTE